jgi:hypothetical protein
VTHNTTLQGKMPMRVRNSAQRVTRGMEKKIVARDLIEEDSYDDGP